MACLTTGLCCESDSQRRNTRSGRNAGSVFSRTDCHYNVSAHGRRFLLQFGWSSLLLNADARAEVDGGVEEVRRVQNDRGAEPPHRPRECSTRSGVPTAGDLAETNCGIDWVKSWVVPDTESEKSWRGRILNGRVARYSGPGTAKHAPHDSLTAITR
jgi:hypothetical protein